MKRLFGGILLAVGILLMTVSGLCSFVFVAAMAASALGNPPPGEGYFSAAIGLIGLVAAYGGVPFAIGFGLFQLGRKLVRDAATPGD
ncbi:hypothetical protein IP88_00630 [alpha proteobacterium AAP81b]|nr:hypothetical protein IP88_00630 [alpha proteobacterium AAP81b]